MLSSKAPSGTPIDEGFGSAQALRRRQESSQLPSLCLFHASLTSVLNLSLSSVGRHVTKGL